MQVPKIDGQNSGEKHEIKAKKEERIGNIPLVQKNKDTPPTEDAGWSGLGVDIKKEQLQQEKLLKKFSK